MKDLSGKCVLVTGAAGGINKAIVTGFQAAGATVLGVDLQNSTANFSITGDLMDPIFCDTLPDCAVETLGGLDILINNAGIITRGDITQASDDDFARTMAINVEAPFRLCRAAIPIMAANGGGAIVNTSVIRPSFAIKSAASTLWGEQVRPTGVANLVTWLASDQAAFVTDQI